MGKMALATTNKGGSRFSKALEKRVLRFIQEHGLLRQGDRVLVGVSGGPDSTALVLILSRLRPVLGLELSVAHFDHRLRSPPEAEADLAFVRGLTEELRLPLVFASGDVKGYAKEHGLSLEEAARRLRYDFYAREAAGLAVSVVAVGHTASDQAETVLLHLIRGSGLAGLRGMRLRAPWPFGEGPALARPLLRIWRQETERYCREMGIVPREDPTNLLLQASRNRIRHQVLPLLRQLNPRIEEALVRLATAASAEVDCMEQIVEGLWAGLAQEGEGEISFPRQEFAGLAPALATRLLGQAVRRLAGPGADLEAVHLEAALAALGKRRSRVSFPYGLTCVIDHQRVRLLRGEFVSSGHIPEKLLVIPGRTLLPGWVIEAEIAPTPSSAVIADPNEAFLDADTAGSPLVVRSRRPGDRLRPLGLGGEKKVQDLLVDAKVPLEERDSVPIVCGPRGIVWVVGLHIDERVAVTAKTSSALRLRAVRRRPSALDSG